MPLTVPLRDHEADRKMWTLNIWLAILSPSQLHNLTSVRASFRYYKKTKRTDTLPVTLPYCSVKEDNFFNREQTYHSKESIFLCHFCAEKFFACLVTQ